MKNYICVLVCELIPCAVNLKEFSNILVSRHGHMHGVPRHFNSKKLKNDQKKHEILLDVMSCHQDDVVNFLACLTKVWTHTPHKPEQLTRRLVVPRGNNACLMMNKRYLPLMAFKIFLRVTCTNTTVMWKFGKFEESFDLFEDI